MSLKNRLDQIKNNVEPEYEEPDIRELMETHPDIKELIIYSYREAYVKTGSEPLKTNLEFSSPSALAEEVRKAAGTTERESFLKINGDLVIKTFMPPFTKDVCAIISRTPTEVIADSFISDEILVYLKNCVENRKNVLITGSPAIDKARLLGMLTELVDDDKTFVICDRYSKIKTEKRTFMFSAFDSRQAAILDYDTLFAVEPSAEELLEISKSVLSGKNGVIAAISLKPGVDENEILKTMLLTTGLSSENAEKIIMQSFDVIINCGTDEENRPFISGIYETSPYKKVFEHELYSEDLQPEEPEPSGPVEEAKYVFDLPTPKKKAAKFKDKIKKKKAAREFLVATQIQTKPDEQTMSSKGEEPANVSFEEISLTAKGVSDENTKPLGAGATMSSPAKPVQNNVPEFAEIKTNVGLQSDAPEVRETAENSAQQAVAENTAVTEQTIETSAFGAAKAFSGFDISEMFAGNVQNSQQNEVSEIPEQSSEPVETAVSQQFTTDEVVSQNVVAVEQNQSIEPEISVEPNFLNQEELTLQSNEESSSVPQNEVVSDIPDVEPPETREISPEEILEDDEPEDDGFPEVVPETPPVPYAENQIVPDEESASEIDEPPVIEESSDDTEKPKTIEDILKKTSEKQPAAKKKLTAKKSTITVKRRKPAVQTEIKTATEDSMELFKAPEEFENGAES